MGNNAAAGDVGRDRSLCTLLYPAGVDIEFAARDDGRGALVSPLSFPN